MAEQDNESPNVKQLRQAFERAQARETAWKDVALQGLVQGAGFDPKDPIVGLLVERFNTDELDPEALDAQAFAKFAKQYNVEPKAPEPPPATPPAVDPATQAQVQAMQQQQGVPATPATPPAPAQPVPQVQPFMSQFQAPADALLNSAAATPAPQPTTLQQQAAAAEAAGDWGSSFNAKFNLTRQMFNANPNPAPHAGPVNDQGLPVHSPGAA